LSAAISGFCSKGASGIFGTGNVDILVFVFCGGVIGTSGLLWAFDISCG
jgi:hypothetical protein